MDKIYVVMQGGRPLAWFSTRAGAGSYRVRSGKPGGVVEVAYGGPIPADVFAKDVDSPEEAPDTPTFAVEHNRGTSEIVADGCEIDDGALVLYIGGEHMRADVAHFAPGTWTSVSRK